ncbi:PilZ domain-containing protein [uncultured Alsobacter sp.]|uniref:PilZ domain-containing protein n=1 Tax=uncultured Alsobacter sp. TaxID=1748258 RepID=UPI0025DF6F5D|nr:PilZ domain-containing protein [uncultured Alsobacter sp.]
MSASNRRHPRLDVTAPACVFAGGQLYPCVIRDMSRGGARIELPAGIDPGKAFALFIGGSDVPYQSQVVWKRDRELGIKFV